MLPADGRNHKKSHRTEFNKRMGRLICGCGWKSEPFGKRRAKRRSAESHDEEIEDGSSTTLPPEAQPERHSHEDSGSDCQHDP